LKKKAKIYSTINLIALLGVIVTNYLANAIPVNGVNTGEVSDMYPNLFAPAPITFAIWGIIYLLLFGFVINQFFVLKNNEDYTFVNDIGIWFIVNCFANMLWILAWHNLKIGISLALTGIILISLLIIYYKLEIGKEKIKYRSKLLVDMPFSIYLGWASIATIANVTTYLVDINWNGVGLSEQLWTVIVILVGLVLAIIFLLKYNDIFFSLVVSWALYGIFIKRVAAEDISYPIVIASVVGASIILVSAIFKILKKEIYLT
jgi:hypothetical protein